MIDWLTQFSTAHPYLIYGVIAVASFIEGPIIAVICGLILRLHDIGFIPVMIALMVGDLVGDSFWYWAGYKGGHRFIARFGMYVGVTEGGVATVSRIFHSHKDSIIFLSKVTMGLGFALATLVTAGMVRIPFKRYIAVNAIGQLFWTGFLIAIGYFVGHLYATIDSIFGKVSVAALLLVIFFGLMGYGRYVRSRVTKP